MSFYEELLTLGEELHEVERLALYKFLKESNRSRYQSDARVLLELKSLTSEIANGDIWYSLNGNVITYSARMKGKDLFHQDLRSCRLSKIHIFRLRQLYRFFAQCEVDVIWNYPIQGDKSHEDQGYTSMKYPYFDLRYFSEGKGPIIGFINKLKVDDSEILRLLRAS